MMKKLFSICAVAVLVVAALTACGGDDAFEEYVSSVKVTAANTIIPVDGGTTTFTVEGDGLSAASSANWLTVHVDGQTVTVTAEANPTSQSRNAVVTISAANGDKSMVSVTQQGVITYVGADSVFAFGYKAVDTVLVNYSNVALTATASDTWIHATAEGNHMRLSVDKNDGNFRKGTLTFSSKAFSQVIKIVQLGKSDAYSVTNLKKAVYEDEKGKKHTVDITITASGTNKWTISGLVPEGDIVLKKNTIEETTYYYIDPFFKIGTVTEGVSTYTLRCNLSAYDTKTNLRAVPQSSTSYIASPSSHEYRIPFSQWKVTNQVAIYMEYEAPQKIGYAKALPEGYTSDGIIVCRYTDSKKLDAASFKDIKYYFLKLKLMSE